MAKKEVKSTKTKKRNLVPVTKGSIYVRSTFNNTLISVTDENGNVIGWASAGGSGFKGARKSTPYAAQTAMTQLIEKIRNRGLKQIKVFVSGVGNGRDAAVRVLSNYDFEVLMIKDITPVAHNGCRQKKVRRV
jgi:small subunit ribosomal protein S11